MAAEARPFISSFYIFHRTWGRREGTEHEKILFYHPHTADIDVQCRAVGLSCALIPFTTTFSPEQAVESVHMLNTRHIYTHCEGEFWMVGVFRNPVRSKVDKGGGVVNQPQPEVLEDSVLCRFVANVWHTVRMFIGPLSTYGDDIAHADELRKQLQHVVPPLLASFSPDELNIVHSYQGIKFLPVNKRLYLQVNAFVLHMQNTFRHIKNTAFFFDDQLVWSGFSQGFSAALFSYITRFVCREYSRAAISSTEPVTLPFRLSLRMAPNGGFVSGAVDLTSDDTAFRVVRVFLDDSAAPLSLLLYKFDRILLAFTMSEKKAQEVAFARVFHSFATAEIEPVARALDDFSNRYFQRDDPYHYIYYNRMNLALNTSLLHGSHRPSAVVWHTLAQAQEELHAPTEATREVCIRTHNDGWVVARKSHGRELYVVLDGRSMPLTSVEEEANKLTDAYFSNIFML